jgi:hypothetical protein
MTHSVVPVERPVPIAGVVDGQLTTTSDQDGNVCMHLLFVSGPRNDRVHVELVLSHDDARQLQRFLADGPAGAAQPVPCCVGLRVGHGYT